jgi:hypothetical protein
MPAVQRAHGRHQDDGAVVQAGPRAGEFGLGPREHQRRRTGRRWPAG